MNKIKILILGKGGREHALAWKLLQSPFVEIVFVAPGNPGMITDGCKSVPSEFCKLDQLLYFAKEVGVNLVIIQQDDMLAAGYADVFRAQGFMVFGPNKAAAKIEWSKLFAKKLMASAGIPTAPYRAFTDANEAKKYARSKDGRGVVKADGLASGKGVTVCTDINEAEAAIDDCLVKKIHGKAGELILIEDLLEGEELSAHFFTDGRDVKMFPFTRDYKRLRNGNKGPNTGGMGVYGIIPVGAALAKTIESIGLACVRALDKESATFSGLLYPGFILTKDGPMVLEFNSRFGDPETQNYMMSLKNDVDLASSIIACIEGRLGDIDLRWKSNPVYAVTLITEGYPENPCKGDVIHFRPDKLGYLRQDYIPINTPKFFHCGTDYNKKGQLVTSGGRVMTVTTEVYRKHPESNKWAYYALQLDDAIRFSGMKYRTDIGLSL